MPFYLSIFGCFIIFVVWLSYELQKSKRLAQKKHDEFWENESNANLTRKVPEDQIPFLDVPFATFPFGKYDSSELQPLEAQLSELEGRKFINMTGKTATNMKEMYGPANLELISDADENFTVLIKLLSDYATVLYEESHVDDAMSILEYCVEIKSDLVSTYRLLATIYKEKGQPEKIQTLSDTASALDSLLKKSILNSLEKIRES